MVLNIDRYTPKKNKHTDLRLLKYKWLKFIRGMKYQPLVKFPKTIKPEPINSSDVMYICIAIIGIIIVSTGNKYILPNLPLLWAVCWKALLLLLFLLIIGAAKNEC